MRRTRVERRGASFGETGARPDGGAGGVTEIRTGSRSRSEEGKTYPSNAPEYRTARHRLSRGPQSEDPLLTLKSKQARLKREIEEKLAAYQGKLVLPDDVDEKIRQMAFDLILISETIHERELQLAALGECATA